MRYPSVRSSQCKHTATLPWRVLLSTTVVCSIMSMMVMMMMMMMMMMVTVFVWIAVWRRRWPITLMLSLFHIVVVAVRTMSLPLQTTTNSVSNNILLRTISTYKQQFNKGPWCYGHDYTIISYSTVRGHLTLTLTKLLRYYRTHTLAISHTTVHVFCFVKGRQNGRRITLVGDATAYEIPVTWYNDQFRTGVGHFQRIFHREGGHRPPTTVGVTKLEWLSFRVVSKYPQCII